MKEFINKMKEEKESEIKKLDLDIIRCETKIKLYEKDKEYWRGFINGIDFCLGVSY